MYEEQLTGIEFKLQKLAQKMRRLETENESLKKENDELRAKMTPAPTAPESEIESDETARENFEAIVNQARKTKRELELYLRETERKISELRF